MRQYRSNVFQQETLTEGEGLSTVNLLSKVAYFVKKVNNSCFLKVADLSWLAQGG